MSMPVHPTIVGRVEDRLTRALERRWLWFVAAGALLVASMAQAGFDDRFLASIAIVLPVGLVVPFPRASTAVATFAALGLPFPDGYPIPVAAGAGLVIVCGVAAYLLTAIDMGVIYGLFLVNAVSPFTSTEPGPAGYLLLVSVCAALGFGRLLRSRSTIIAEHHALALAHTSALYEHQLLADRTAIARELHDVVAHHISHIALQAETARYTTPDLPELAEIRLVAIGESARSALDEMRRILTVIRRAAPARDAAVAGRPESALSPRPGLDQLDELVDAARGDGTAVTLGLSGPATPIPPDTDVVAYRVIQEALTNARRHAPGAEVDVAVDHTPRRLSLTISNGSGHSPAGSGSTGGIGLGLIGMRERVDAVGGTLHHGERPDGGFTVVAMLPLGQNG